MAASKNDKIDVSENNASIDIKRKEIDFYLDEKQYCKAFGLLVSLLKDVDPSTQQEILSYYEGRIYSVSNEENDSFRIDPYNNLR